MHQLQTLVSAQQPQVDGGTLHDFSELFSDDGPQLIHLKRRGKRLFKIVELRQAADRCKRVVSFAFVAMSCR